MKNILTQLSIPMVLWHNSFVAMPWFTKRQCQGTAGTVWSTSPGPKFPSSDAARLPYHGHCHNDDTQAPQQTSNFPY